MKNMNYNFLKSKYLFIKIASLAVLFLLMAFSALIGIANIKTDDGVKVILSHIPILGKLINLEGIAQYSQLIIWNLRVPRIILAALTGASLAVSGAVYQGIFRNPMADPYVLGISSGAALGASIGLVTSEITTVFGVGMITLFAFMGAIITALLVFGIARTGGRLPTTTLLLSGVAVSFLLSSLLTLVMVFNRKAMERIIFWTMGSFNGTSWTDIWIILPVSIVGYIIIRSFSRELDIMTTGDDTARSLGVDVEKNKKILMGVSTVLVSASVAVCGIIGFVGLIIPHIARLIFKPSHKILLPFSALFGAMFMLIADTVARNFLPLVSSISAELPVGAVTALFGAPFFIGLLIKGKRKVM